ncbi:MAG: universal stress protein [Proteobacteria bacterium]|nr:universal stress protein [Pseudomonadota bacterium]MBU1386521.1 universal stress protein [Pseudomonadota bacterium]MBU1544632.1 universal stress protein [Pseudomonadota bacterium]MBU2429227.1 universal stress protein [Pseudomonadota bacterium]MBU2481389.1 universal stress protein [Pseudomonadota bacterium]
MFKKMLFATTASPVCDAVAKIAFELGQKYSAELIVCHVYGPSGHDSNFSHTDDSADVSTKGEHTQNTDSIDRIKDEMQATYAALIKKHGQPRFEIPSGDPAARILQLAEKENVDCILMGPHTRQEDTADERFRGIAGTTLQKVTQRARCPVLVVSRPCETCFWYFNKIIFGTDFSDASMAAFQFAFNLAKTIGCKLYIFHALDINATQAGILPGQTTIENRIKAAKTRIEEDYICKIGDFDNFEITIWEGVPYVELLKFAREISGDLIVMAHHTESNDQNKALLGTTVEQVILRSACPVASVNPSL